MEKYRVGAEAYALVERAAKNGGHSARVFVPKAWEGKKVMVLLLEPLSPSD